MLIAQLSDIHVRPKDRLYKDVADSNQGFANAINHLHNLDQAPDVVLITGDLVDEGKVDEYEYLVELLGTLNLPYVLMPGNHDDRHSLRAAFPEHRYLPSEGAMHYCVDQFPVRIIALDSTVPGQHYGHIDAVGLDWLKETLASNPEKPTIVGLHHPPFVSGIPYLDRCRYLEPDALASVLEGFKNVEAVICGHVHRAMSRRWAGTIVNACPSTTTEIALQLDPKAKPLSYKGPPACMLHRWEPGLGLVTHISYIGKFDGPYPFF